MPSYGCASFNGAMRRLMEEQGGTESGQKDALRTAQREIEGVREIMTENIERVLERGERIDLLVDKTDRLGTTARDFRVRSRGLRRRMWWKNIKLMVLLGLVVVFLLYLFVGFGCGLPGKWSFWRCGWRFANFVQRGDDACIIKSGRHTTEEEVPVTHGFSVSAPVIIQRASVNADDCVILNCSH